MAPRKQKCLATVLIALALLAVTTGGVFAYLVAEEASLTNILQKDQELKPTITETVTNNVKTDVAVNVGNPGYAVYVRAAILINWVDESGNVRATAPVKGTDYEISLNESDWFYNPADGFYYHRAMVTSGNNTAALINSCQMIGTAPAGYHLNVEIVAQTIQALGTTDDDTSIPAVQDAWGIEVNSDKTLKDPN